jgi:hypothetical protein
VSSEKQVLDGTFDIRPGSPLMSWRNNSSVIDWGSEKEIVDGKNVEIYESNVDYPANCVVNFPVSQMRKWKFVPLEFIPFQYNPVTKKLTLTNYIKLNVSFNLSMFANATLLASQRDLALDDYAPQVFKNYIELKDLYVGEPDLSWPGSIAIGYVIITTDAIKTGSSKLNAFVAHKDSLGYAVQVITEDDFGSLNGQAPNHKAEKIREWLKNNYNSGIRYVLLIGNPSPYESGEGDIPMKICWPNKINSKPADSTPTDSFYSDLTGNWDLDGDGYYGELDDDYGPSGGVNFAPEVIVGRIPVYNADYASLDGILQKIIDYEKSNIKGWRKSALLPESFIAQTVDGAVLGERIKDDFLIPKGYSYWRIYQQGSGKCGTHSSYPSDQDLKAGTGVRDRWASNPRGIVCWSGHGGDTVAQVGYSTPTLDCVDGWFFMSSYCSALDNTHPSFTYQASCSNGYPETPNNLQYAILKQGGISTVAATRPSWFGGETYENIVGSNSIFGIGYEYIKSLIKGEAGGDSLALVKVNNPLPVGNGWLQNFYDFNIYGDPSVDLGIISKPVLDNYMALLITSNSAWLTGVLTDTGNENSDVYICWGRTDGGANPNSWEHTEYIGKMGIGGFFTSIDNLVPGTKYYYRCYAANSAGTSWASSTATFTTQSPPASPSTISVFRNGGWYFDSNGDRIWSTGDTTGWFGATGDLPVAGDWDGNGKDEVAVFRNGGWYFDADGCGYWCTGDTTGWFGTSGDRPVAGDWDGNGKDEIAVFRNGGWYFDANGDGYWSAGDTTGWFGTTGDLPAAGDWDGNGKDEIAVFRNGGWYFDTNGDRYWSTGDTTGWFGATGDKPVAGRWRSPLSASVRDHDEPQLDLREMSAEKIRQKRAALEEFQVESSNQIGEIKIAQETLLEKHRIDSLKP